MKAPAQRSGNERNIRNRIEMRSTQWQMFKYLRIILLLLRKHVPANLVFIASHVQDVQPAANSVISIKGTENPTPCEAKLIE